MVNTGAKSNYLENAIVNHVIGQSAYTSPTVRYLALFTGDPTEASSFTLEVQNTGANGYARVDVTSNFFPDAPYAGAGSVDGYTHNTGVITFPQAVTNYGPGAETVSHWAIVDQLNVGEGNMLYFGDFDTAKAIDADDTPEIASGALTIQEH